MKAFSSIVYNTKNPGKYKKEKTYQKIKDYFLKIALTGDSKILFRCYDINNLDCTCYQSIKSPEEIFDSYEDMKIYETGSVLFNVITKKFNYDYSIDYNKEFDIITIENKDINRFNFDKNLKFELHKESITCLKEYIFILCQTIKKLKDDSSNIKEDISNIKDNNDIFEISKIPNILSEIEKLKKEIEQINSNLIEKQNEIDSLKAEKESSKKLIAKNTTELNNLKQENKNMKIAISDSQEDIEKINK